MADIWYRVKAEDTPAGIARKITGNPARMTELVLANPAKPRQIVGGQLTFASLKSGEGLVVPKEWARPARTGLSGTGLGSVQDDVSSILAANLANAFSLKSAGDSAPETVVTGNAADDQTAIQHYRDAAADALDTMGMVNVWTLDLQGDYPQLNVNGLTSGMVAAQNAANPLVDPGATPDRGQAQQAATDVITGAQSVLTAAKAVANTALGLIGGGTAPGNAATAASALANYVAQHGCDHSGTYTGLVKAFQAAYNADMATGKYPGSPAGKPLTVDGVVAGAHSHNTLTALGQVSSQYASLCSIPAPSPAPSPTPTPTPTPTPSPGPTTNVNVNQKPAGTPWGLILGAAAVAAGGGALFYYSKKQHPGARHAMARHGH